ncbi:MAG: hypothetical protein ACO1OG_01115 [Devosia sp.]
MKLNIVAVAIAAVFAVSMSAMPANAGLLKKLGDTVDKTVNGVVDTVDDVVDTVTDTVDDTTGLDTGDLVDNVVTINDTGNDGLVNLDTTGNNNVLTATVGPGGKPLVDARIGLLNGPNSISINLGDLGIDLVIDIGIPDPNDPDAPVNPPEGRILVGSIDGANSFVVTCAVDNAKTLLQVAAQGKVTGAEVKAWQRASAVQVVPIALCPDAKMQISQVLAKSQKIQLLRRAVMSDNLIMASLGRTKYGAEDVVAVQRKSGALVVYVY